MHGAPRLGQAILEPGPELVEGDDGVLGRHRRGAEAKVATGQLGIGGGGEQLGEQLRLGDHLLYVS